MMRNWRMRAAVAAVTVVCLIGRPVCLAAETVSKSVEAVTEEVSEGAVEEAVEAVTEEAFEAVSEEETEPAVAPTGEKVVLRICNWEEYIDLGDWDEEETIDLDSGDIIGENSLVDDFEDWYLRTFGIDVDVEYSTFGTNEDLYNMLTLGDVYDLVCPSEYMFMKLIDEGFLVPLSDEFYDESIRTNYYARGLSPYIRKVLDGHEINGEPWSKYAAGYMWGITGIVYNPDEVTHEEASTWSILDNPKFARRVTIKDNVRDSYFAAIGALKRDLLTSAEFQNDPDYRAKLEAEMNDVSPEAIAMVQDYLQDVKNNAYSQMGDVGSAQKTVRVASAVCSRKRTGHGNTEKRKSDRRYRNETAIAERIHQRVQNKPIQGGEIQTRH